MLTLVIKVSIFILIRLALFTLLLSLIFCYSTENATAFERNKVDSLNRVFAKEKVDTTKSRLLCEIGMQYYYYDNDSALLYAERSYQLAKKINYIPVKLKAYNFIGIVLLLKGEYTKGEKIFKELISESNRHQDSSVLAKSLGNLGLTYYYMGDYDKSLPYFYQALTLAEKIKFYSLVSSTLNNIANVYSVQKKYDKALEINLRSLKLAKEQGNKKSEANILNSLGVIYDSKNDKVTALEYYRKSLKIKQELNDINGQISALLNISDSYLVLKNYDQAENYLDQAQNLAENINDQEKITKSLFLKGLIALNKNNYSKAETNFLEGAKLADEIQARMLQLDANRYLYELYKKKNSYSTALKYLERYTELKDTVYNEESSKEMAEMEAKYENDKKQKEIQLLENQKKLQESELEKKEAQAKKNKILLITFVIGFVLVMISLVVSIRAFKQKQKANLLLAQQKNEIEKQNEEIQLQKHIVDEKQKEILDSINYAKRIQFALLASETLLQNNLPEYFVLFKPKDVVSGDFYWATPTENGFIYITADCTGHGVPGAFMSLLNISKLSQTINENKIDKPDLILNNVRNEIINALNPKGSTMDSKDGMDAVLCSLNKKEMKLEYAAANNSFYIIRNNELIICKADKMPVGKGFDDSKSFSLNTIDLQKNDVIYTFTDGYADQFGGPKGKKFKYKQLEDLLMANYKLPMTEQKNILEDAIETWKGSLEQVDDILVIGVRV